MAEFPFNVAGRDEQIKTLKANSLKLCKHFYD